MTEAEQIKALEAQVAELTKRVNELDALVYFVRTDIRDYRRAVLMRSAGVVLNKFAPDQILRFP
jgi:hypothetical protein